MYALADCNNFFVSCERALQPQLEGKPVVVLSNNDGCVVARSNEAKAMGIKMGTPFFKVKDLVDKGLLTVRSSNYTLYGDLSSRVMSILSGAVPRIEVYSIDEAFLIIEGMDMTKIPGLCHDLVFKIRNLCTSAGSAVTTVMLPRLSYYTATDSNQQKATGLMAKNMNFLLMLGLSIITALVICAEPIIAILGGNDYLGAAPTMRISAPIVLVSSISAMLSQYMIATDHEKSLTITNVVGVALAVACECALILLMGISGAALVLVITELVVYAMRAYILRDYMKHVRKHTDYGRIIIAWAIASVAAGGVFWLVRNFNPFLSITAAAITFLTAFGILLVLFKEVFIMSMIHNRRHKN